MLFHLFNLDELEEVDGEGNMQGAGKGDIEERDEDDDEEDEEGCFFCSFYLHARLIYGRFLVLCWNGF